MEGRPGIIMAAKRTWRLRQPITEVNQDISQSQGEKKDNVWNAGPRAI